MLTRVEMKDRAKQAMSSAKTHPCIITLIFMLITGVIFGGFSAICQVIVFALAALDNVGIAMVGMVLYLAAFLVLYAVVFTFSIGNMFSMLKVARHQENNISDIFAYKNRVFKILGLYLMMGLRIFLWSLLFYVPGIIAAIRYSMAMNIFIDNPDKGINQCIDESKQMMNGYKGDFFVLQLSFILWYLLGTITCGLAYIYVTPYVQVTNCIFYDNLKYLFYNGNAYQGNSNGQGMNQVPPVNNMYQQPMNQQVPPMNNDMYNQGMNQQVPPMNNAYQQPMMNNDMYNQGMNQQVPPMNNAYQQPMNNDMYNQGMNQQVPPVNNMYQQPMNNGMYNQVPPTDNNMQ